MPADHGVGVLLGQGRPGELPGRAADGAKQPPLGIGGDAAAVQISVQVGFKIVVARQFIALAALLAQPLHEHVLDLHGERRADKSAALEIACGCYLGNGQRQRLMRPISGCDDAFHWSDQRSNATHQGEHQMLTKMIKKALAVMLAAGALATVGATGSASAGGWGHGWHGGGWHDGYRYDRGYGYDYDYDYDRDSYNRHYDRDYDHDRDSHNRDFRRDFRFRR
jgi:hypothetical protein